MAEILENSVVFVFIVNFIKKTLFYYENSIFGIFIEKIKQFYKISRTKKILRNYARKDPYFRYSIVYKIIDKISGGLSVICGFLNKSANYISSGSEVKKNIVSAKNSGGNLILIYTGFFIALSVLVYLLCCVCFVSLESINVDVCALLMAFAFICMILGNIWDYVKNSVIFGFFVYLFKD